MPAKKPATRQGLLERIAQQLAQGIASAQAQERCYTEAPIDAGNAPFIWDEDDETSDGVSDPDGDILSDQVQGDEEGHADFGSLVEVALPGGEQDTFASMTEFMAYIAQPVESKLGRASQDDGFDVAHFTQTQTYEEAVSLAEHGWPEGLEMVKKMSARLSDKIVKRLNVPEVRYDVVGDCIDIGRYVAGEPEDFMYIEPAEVEQHPKVIHIVASVGALGNVSNASMIARGAGVVALVDALEQHGKRVIVDVVSPNRGSNTHQVTTLRIRVKDADAPVNMANLVYTLAHPSMLRRLVFSWREHMPDHKRIAFGYFIGDSGVRHKYGGYGRSVDVPLDERGDVYIDSLVENLSEYSVERLVLQRIEAAGIIVEKERAYA
jgi:hypothetical protein